MLVLLVSARLVTVVAFPRVEGGPEPRVARIGRAFGGDTASHCGRVRLACVVRGGVVAPKGTPNQEGDFLAWPDRRP